MMHDFIRTIAATTEGISTADKQLESRNNGRLTSLVVPRCFFEI